MLTSHDSSAIEQQITSSINQGFEKLADKLAGLTSSTTDSTFNSCHSSENDKLPMFGMPSVVTNKVDLPNLSNRHIMWCKVKSGGRGINLSLPLDSCCSVSLCSLEHAKLMQEKYPSFKWVKLPSPVAIHMQRMKMPGCRVSVCNSCSERRCRVAGCRYARRTY